MLRRKLLWSAVLVALIGATTVQAQDRRQGRSGFGGPGMFGASNSQLLGTPEVQKELGVTDEQKGLIEDMVADIREKMREAFGGGGFQERQNLSQEEREKRAEEMRKRFEEVQKKSDEMVAMILEPKQLDRLQQLRLQQEGIGAFRRDDVAQKIGLTEEQREKIRKLQEEARSAGTGGPVNFQDMSEEERREFRTRMQERFTKLNSDILGVLTPDQKATWEKMQGKKFDFPPPPGFGGRRPGGEGGQGGRPGGEGGGRRRPDRDEDR